MPYKFQTDKIKLPREYDRRVKITEEMKKEMKAMHEDGAAVRAIARYFVGRCSRDSIRFILMPDKEVHAKALFKERQKDGRYYHKEKATRQKREHRRYKQEIIKNLKLEAGEGKSNP